MLGLRDGFKRCGSVRGQVAFVKFSLEFFVSGQDLAQDYSQLFKNRKEVNDLEEFHKIIATFSDVVQFFKRYHQFYEKYKHFRFKNLDDESRKNLSMCTTRSLSWLLWGNILKYNENLFEFLSTNELVKEAVERSVALLKKINGIYLNK